MAFSRFFQKNYFSKKSSIIDLRLDSKFATEFFSWRLQNKVNVFINFSLAINFSDHYLPEMYLELSQASTMKIFRGNSQQL